MQRITDTADIDKIFSAISSIYVNVKEEAATPTKSDFLSPDSVDTPAGIIEFTGFIITFCEDDKTEVAFTLEGDILCRVNDNFKVKIDDSQLTMLKNMLGI
jgi:hypothetical protein